MSAKASGVDTGAGGNSGGTSQTRAFTIEQKTAVIRVRKCQTTAFYEILSVSTTASDGEIKRAYRKLSLLTHPDKNGYEGADEAFKMVSRAFQVLSDPEKKARFDRFGGDPDSRFGAGGPSGGAGPGAGMNPNMGNPFAGFARASRGGPGFGGGNMFEEEITPEEIFNRFFGGAFGGGGGGFGPFGGENIMFNMGGGPGIRVHQFGGRPRRRPTGAAGANQEDDQQSPLGIFTNMLPLLILFGITMISSLFSAFGDTAPRVPEIRLSADPPFTAARTMPRYRVPYWVRPADVTQQSTSKLAAVDAAVERQYIGTLQNECARQRRRREVARQDAMGWLSYDEVKLREANAMEMTSCDRLTELRAPISY